MQKISSLGIQLIRSLTNECNYIRVNDKNIITLYANLLSQGTFAFSTMKVAPHFVVTFN